MNFRFVHAADLHLDTPFEGISRLGKDVSERLRDASLEAFDNLIRTTIEEEADFLLIAGDVYDGAERGIRAQMRFLDGMRRLDMAGIRVFIVHGNHDPLEGWSAISNWPSNVTIAGSDGVECHEVEVDGRTAACVHGISYAKRDQRENLSKRYRRNDTPGIHIGLLHCNAGSVTDHAAYSPCTIDDLVETRMDYWALGHVHARRILHRGDPWIAYPGNLQGRSPKSTELGAKGAFVVDVVDGEIREPRFVALDVVRFVVLDFSIEDAEDLAVLQDVMLERAGETKDENRGRGLIIRAYLRDASQISRDLKAPGKLADFVESLRDATGRRWDDVWWESVRDRSTLPVDLAAIRRRDDFASALLERAEALAAHPEEARRFYDRAVDEIRSSKCLDEADSAVVKELVEEAKMLALGMLEGGAAE